MQDSIVAQAAEAIREFVISRGLMPGQRLPSERELADSLGTSRPALREAIRRLEADRVIDVRGRSGMYVAAIDVADLFAVRQHLEPFAARLTAELRTPSELRELQALVAELRRRVADPPHFSKLDRQLHSSVAQFSRNSVLAGFILQLNDLTVISRGTTVRDDDTRLGTVEDMTKLVAAIKLRDGDAASEAMRVHVQRIEQTASGQLAQGHLPSRLSTRR
jgi:DNA-binding FadR family transcriptional regulator